MSDPKHFGTPPGFWLRTMTIPSVADEISRMYATPGTANEPPATEEQMQRLRDAVALQTTYWRKRVSYTGRDGQRHIGRVVSVDTERKLCKVRRGPHDELVEITHIHHTLP